MGDAGRSRASAANPPRRRREQPGRAVHGRARAPVRARVRARRTAKMWSGRRQRLTRARRRGGGEGGRRVCAHHQLRKVCRRGAHLVPVARATGRAGPGRQISGRVCRLVAFVPFLRPFRQVFQAVSEEDGRGCYLTGCLNHWPFRVPVPPPPPPPGSARRTCACASPSSRRRSPPRARAAGPRAGRDGSGRHGGREARALGPSGGRGKAALACGGRA